jgi:hypothetical protein
LEDLVVRFPKPIEVVREPSLGFLGIVLELIELFETREPTNAKTRFRLGMRT